NVPPRSSNVRRTTRATAASSSLPARRAAARCPDTTRTARASRRATAAREGTGRAVGSIVSGASTALQQRLEREDLRDVTREGHPADDVGPRVHVHGDGRVAGGLALRLLVAELAAADVEQPVPVVDARDRQADAG